MAYIGIMNPPMIFIDNLPRPADLLKLLGVAVLYALLAKIVLTFFSANGVVSIVWPPSGLALAVLLMGGNRYAAGVFLGALMANAMTGLPLGTAAIIATGNTLEALLGAWLLTRDGKFDPNFRSLYDYSRLIVLAGFFGVSVSAINGSTTLLVSGFLTSEAYFLNLLHWWMGDALGILFITPLMLVWRSMPKDWVEPKRVIEVMLVLGLTFLIGQVVFLDWFRDTLGKVAGGYWMFLFVTWAAVRLGIHGVLVLILIVAVQALVGAAQGTGFFSDDMAKTQLTNYWFYMMILSISGMALATYISERKRAESALHESEQRHRMVFENSPVSIWEEDFSAVKAVFDDLRKAGVADIDAYFDQHPETIRQCAGLVRIVDVNQASLALFEATSKEKVLAGLVNFFTAESFDTFRQELVCLWNGEPRMIKDAVVKTLAGDSRNVTVCYSVCHGCEETLSKVIVSLSDITERKRNEAALQAMRAEMEQLMRFHVASQTVSALAHELHQPLNAVTSYAEAALRLLRAGNPQPERLLHAIESSTQQAQRAGQVVRELLAFMKQGEVQTEPVDLNDLVRQVLDRIDADGYGGFQTRLQLDPGLAPVTANRLQLEKVLLNLIENGVDAMRDAGISTHANTITVRTNPEGPMAQVTVRDSGPGIDPQTLHRIFDPFFTTKPKGLGMGLAISRAIIELHGGQLWVESEPASGASFHFTLPFAP